MVVLYMSGVYITNRKFAHTLFVPFLSIFVDLHHSMLTSIFSHSNFKILLLIKFLSNKNSNECIGVAANFSANKTYSLEFL
jgi:hypothetical protein